MAIATTLTGSDQAVHTTHSTFFGATVRNSHASDAVTVTVYNDPNSADGDILAAVALAAGASQTVWLGPQGVIADLGVYVDIGGTGTAVGAVFTG